MHEHRRYDLDWIRVIATLAVFFYHCSMFVNPFPWHIKNNELNSTSILVFSLFLGLWIMPIFFAVSGISTFYALKQKQMKGYIKERFQRLAIPLIFGVFVLAPPQVYIEKIYYHQFNDSFLRFIPRYFDGLYLEIGGAGNFAFFGLHLWFLLVLLVFSVLALPLFVLLRKCSFKRLHFVLLPSLLVGTGFVKTQNLGGWDLLFYLVLFLYGYYFILSDDFRRALQSQIKIYFILAVSLTIVYVIWFLKGSLVTNSAQGIIFHGIQTLSSWSWLLVIFSLANKYLSFSNRFLTYGSEASMPFYVLHQPVIVFYGFLIYDLTWPTTIKILFLLTVSFITIMVTYHFLIRNVAVLRVVFGLKKKRPIGESTTPKMVTLS
ncbi:acyltransferase family protein [Halalkalibacter akibai]|uniref:Acyltransferase family protein n=1 Tax=Halalkalibacter akibai (strain ATCC 43226 / DSM 21942 / CIP 109018 / JCM 9157 / 1139) TaxID=1236973 RepID=W4QUH7_HALA3|nr:acyltransferase [Halalkalibacter akibai]GAE35741.1 acyltransferase family protein [Halalkalibacter akibai JCM 9157]